VSAVRFVAAPKANAAVKDAMNSFLWRLGSIVPENDPNRLSDEACQKVL